MSQKQSTRQQRQHTVLPMLGNAVDDTLDSVLSKIDAELAKHFEDRNVLLTDGGIVTFTGTQVQFTEALNLVLNQKISGAAPQIISLGATTRTLSASGRLIYAVIDRTAGTAVVTADATTLPASVAANQEVFLIAKRIDATDGTQRLYFRTGAAFNAGQSARLGSAGSGSGGSGTGDDLNALTFKASFTDTFDDIPTAANAAVDTTAGKTDATLYSAVSALFQLNYDAAKTVTTVGTAATMSAAPAFTVKAGDLLIVSGQAIRIGTVTSQTVYVLDSALSTDVTAAQATVSQAVYTKDLNNFAVDGLPVSNAFSTTINQVLAIYEDTSAAGDKIFDANTVPVIGFTASSDNSSFTAVQVRPTLLSDNLPLVNLPTASTSLYLRLFANKTTGTGTVNVLGYKVFFHRDTASLDGTTLNQASALTNGAGTQVNIASMSVLGGKTTIKTSFSFPVAVNAGSANGSIKVYLNGQKVPRFISSTATPDASYTEIDQNTIQLDSDYSSLSLLLEVIQDVAVVDASDTNVTAISQQKETMQNGFQGFVAQNQLINATSNSGTPAPGTFYSQISNRSPIVDHTQDLKVRMGIERIMFQGLSLIPNETGPSSDPVWSISNDSNNQIRLVGQISQTPNVGGVQTQFSVINDFMEVTFYGTGLNLVTYLNTTAFDMRATVDGGAESANLLPSGSVVINNRNYSVNCVINAASGLTLGTHTIKIRNNSTNGGNLYGVEILNEVSSLRITPGVGYVAGQKMSTLSTQSSPYNSGFESGTLGTRGGRVVVYQKADGSIAKAVQPVGAQANLGSADHTNEEVSRTHDFREFGDSRADDFSLLSSTVTNAAFTLDDGSTTLIASSAQSTNSSSSPVQEYLSISGTGTFLTITFIGTGLDVQLTGSTIAGEVMNVSIDGSGTVGTLAGTQGRATNIKVCSGLQYGTHTVRITRSANVAFFGIRKFVVYQPKKPAVPSGSLELADYNVLADSVLQSAGSSDTVSSGVIRKTVAREITFVGTWSSQLNINAVGGMDVFTGTNGDYAEYTFFGTGVEFRFGNTTTSGSLTMSIDGSTNLSAFSTSFVGLGITSFTASTGVIATGTTSINGNSARVSGLALGLHKVRITKTSGAANWFYNAFDIIAPIHSAKSNVTVDLQNTLPIGSQGISDNRKTTIVKDLGVRTKAASMAVGITFNPNTSSSVFTPCPDMTCVVKTEQGILDISYAINILESGNVTAYFQLYVDGLPVGNGKPYATALTSNDYDVYDRIIVPVSAGTHIVQLYWRTNSGTLTAGQINRNLVVLEK
jgi:hypothetical protein